MPPETTMSTLLSSLPERLRRGDAAALLEIAHATHGRALAVVRAAGWSDDRPDGEREGTDPEALLLDAYVALYFRRAEAPDEGAEAWALAEVLAYCEQRAMRGGRGTGGGRRGRRRGPLGARVRVAVRSAVQTLVHAVAHAAGRNYARPSACGGSAG
jgi:hypothetical protein